MKRKNPVVIEVDIALVLKMGSGGSRSVSLLK